MDATELGPGTTLGGDFRIERPLSAGGMGAVFVAVQLSTGKQRALKVMHSSLVADPVMRERFEREARVGAMVPSDHVVEVVGAGVDAALGVPWLAMELLTGENLADHVARRGPLSAAEAAEILRPVCHALGAAHARGVVHRDVKPENVVLDMGGKVRVTDLGLAKLLSDNQNLTASGIAVGTPHYISPEQARGKKDVDHRADVYSLGATLFHLVCGRPPYDGEAAEVMRMHVFDETPDPMKFNATLSRPTRKLILDLMQKKPEDRPQSAERVAAEIDKIIGHISTVAQPAVPSVPPPPPPPPGKQRPFPPPPSSPFKR